MEYTPLELKPFDSVRIAELLTYGMEIGIITIVIGGLLGFTISKFINLMKG